MLHPEILLRALVSSTLLPTNKQSKKGNCHLDVNQGGPMYFRDGTCSSVSLPIDRVSNLQYAPREIDHPQFYSLKCDIPSLLSLPLQVTSISRLASLLYVLLSGHYRSLKTSNGFPLEIFTHKGECFKSRDCYIWRRCYFAVVFQSQPKVNVFKALKGLLSLLVKSSNHSIIGRKYT